MELKFIWIKKYKNIEETGFNFNHSEGISFKYVNDELIIEKNQYNTPKGFFKNNITGLTAIVGKNGSGKTNLSEFINFNLAHVTNGGLSMYFSGYKGILIIDKYIFIQEDLPLKNRAFLEQLGYIIYDYKDAPLDKQNGLNWAEMSHNRYIYYSPNFEFRYINMRDNLTNISTSYLAFNDLYDSLKSHRPGYEDDFFSRQKTSDSLLTHYVSEMIRESDFILNFNSEKYIGESPTKLKVSIDAVNENRLLKSPSFISRDETETDKRKIKKHNLWSELAELENNIWNYSWSEMDSFKSRNEDQYYDVYKIPIEAQKEFFRKLFFINLFKILLVLDQDFDEGFFNSFLYNKEFVTNEKEIVDINNKLSLFIDECIWEEKEQKARSGERDNIFKLIRSTEIELDTEYRKSIFNDLLNACKAITGNRHFFHYEFNHNYSSGQQNLLNFYSRFYWAKNDLIDIETGEYEFFRKKLVVFIDEGEVALHPEWQRRFFNQSINFLSELFEDREIQLILTTHSPFVLSDIPKRNILFLDRDTNSGKTKLVDMEKENTFGANIYALLTDSFFMENTIGEFAHQKMKLVLDTLSNDKVDINEERKAEFRFIIDNIGEPLIKEQLEHLYNLKFGSDEIRELRQRIIELESKLNNKEDDNIKN